MHEKKQVSLKQDIIKRGLSISHDLHSRMLATVHIGHVKRRPKKRDS